METITDIDTNDVLQEFKEKVIESLNMVVLMTVDHKLQAWHFWCDIGHHLLELLEPYSVTTDRGEQTDPVNDCQSLDSCNALKRKPRAKRAKRVSKKNVRSKKCKTVIENVDNENNVCFESDHGNEVLEHNETEITCCSNGQTCNTGNYELTEPCDVSSKNVITEYTDCMSGGKQNDGTCIIDSVPTESRRSSSRIAENNITPKKADWSANNLTDLGLYVTTHLADSGCEDQTERTNVDHRIMNTHHNDQMPINGKSTDKPEEHKPVSKRNGRLYVPDIPKCPKCGLILANVHNLFVHLRSHNNERPYSCDVCPKTFHTKGNMQRHEKTHAGAKPYICSICSKGFTEKRSLKVHQRCHTGEKPYACAECGKRFSQSGVLVHHMAIHTGIRPYLCNQCGRDFTQKSQLKAHESRHANHKPFICDYPKCSFCFVSKSELARHKLRHSNSKPHLCSVCPKSFSRLQYLKDHMNHHDGVRPHVCSMCQKSFYDFSALYKHRASKHSQQEAEQANEVSTSVSTLQTSSPQSTVSNQTIYLSGTGSVSSNLVPLVIQADVIRIYTQQRDLDEVVCETLQGSQIQSESTGSHNVD